MALRRKKAGRNVAARKKAGRKKAAKRRTSVATSIETIEAAEDILTPRQVRFAYEYLVALNATKAAIAAGCPAGSASVQGSKWLANPKVAALIDELKTQRAERSIYSSDDVLADLKPICTSDLRDFLDDEGKLVGNIKDLPREVTAALGEMTQTERFDQFGNAITETKFKLHGKVPALALAGKHVDVAAFEERTSGSQTVKMMVVDTGLSSPPGGEA